MAAAGFLSQDIAQLCNVVGDIWNSHDLTDAASRVYASSALGGCLMVCTAFMALCFVAGEVTGNLSQVDKLWSLAPAVYMWVIATHPSAAAEGRDKSLARVWLMLALVQMWSIRLTFNFWRRGGYTWPPWSGEEDYRWEYVRQFWFMKYGPLRLAFHLGFVCVYQHLLLLALVLPAFAVLPAVDGGGGGVDGLGLNIVDAVASILFLSMLVTETLADQQQWNFQNKKHALKKAGKNLSNPYCDGFIRSGLWYWSAHPNYASEQGMWIVLYLFAVANSGSHQPLAIAGAVNLVLLFKPSVDLSEGITLGKYAKYSSYLQDTPRFLSWKLLVPLFGFMLAAPSLLVVV